MTGLTFGQAAARLGCDVNVIPRGVRTEQALVIVDRHRRQIPARQVAEQLALLKM